MIPVFVGRDVHVSRNLAVYVASESDMDIRRIGIANRMLEAADSCHTRKLVISGLNPIPPELITYTRLTHLNFCGCTAADDVVGLIHKLPHLVSLCVVWLFSDEPQTDLSIPACTEHEPMTPLDTQIRRLSILNVEQEGSLEPALSMLKYLLLRIPTLKFVKAQLVPEEQIQSFIDEYVQWYPHLANVKLTE
ncbi:hypothetical protein H4R19_001039 [Coemansia spiralis]|nr:hypothetical protein H4R19_001039 [Coemansia spiralis]